MIHAIECERSQTTLSEQYIRFGAVPAGADPRFYDLGRFSIATVGMQAASVNIGELWVSYDIEFLKPIELPPQSDALMAFYNCDLAATLNTHPVAVYQPAVYDNIGVTFDAPSPLGNVVKFPHTMRTGTVLQVILYRFGTAASTQTPSETLAGGLSLTGGSALLGYLQAPLPAPASSEVMTFILWVKYDGTGTAAVPPSITYSSYVGPTTPDYAWLFVTEVNASLSTFSVPSPLPPIYRVKQLEDTFTTLHVEDEEKKRLRR